jgi:hypothetical protein
MTYQFSRVTFVAGIALMLATPPARVTKSVVELMRVGLGNAYGVMVLGSVYCQITWPVCP